MGKDSIVIQTDDYMNVIIQLYDSIECYHPGRWCHQKRECYHLAEQKHRSYRQPDDTCNIKFNHPAR
jgi:hypothetical protein